MSILKFLRAEDNFVRIPNQTAQDVRLKSDGLSVITYLASHSENWVPRETDVRRRFGFGKDKMRAVWRGLEAAGYCERHHRQKLGGGRIGTITTISVLPVFATGEGFTDSGLPVTGEPATGSPDDGSPTTLKRRIDEKKNNEKTTTTTERGGDGANAPENHNPIPKLDFPSSIPAGERLGLLNKLAGVDAALRADIIATLASKLARVAGGKSEAVVDVQAYAAGLIRRAKMNELDVPQAVVAGRQNSELEDKLENIKQSIDDGGCLYVDGDAAPVDMWPLAKIGNGHANIAALIKRGAQVEVRHA